jgi:twitching motility protein PilT
VAGLAPDVLDRYLRVVTRDGGSDLLLAAGAPPMVRIDGQLVPIPGEALLSPESVTAVVSGFLGATLRARVAQAGDVDFAFGWGDADRFRGNAFMQRGAPALSLRGLPVRVPTPEELGMPAAMVGFADVPRGLVLVTGPTGSGKTTTLAALVGHIAARRSCHVLTIEDPIEYEFPHVRAAVTQRQIGTDSPSFSQALRAALREDPDVVLVGEMRDHESIQTTLTLAETGHLVLATLHTNDTAQAIDRVVDVFPGERQGLVRVQLGATLVGVVAQRLVPRVGGGRVGAYEVLVGTTAVRATVRDGRSEQLRNLVATGSAAGMQTLEAALRALVDAGTVTIEDALGVSAHPGELTR